MTVAHTALGDLYGDTEDGVDVFRGVPYARPPIHELRFMPPEAVPSWQGLRDATQHGPIAPQAPSRLRMAMGDFARPQDEDCLTLTIWTPAADTGRRPVVVWLHGGAWISGAGSLDWYSGARLAHEGGLVVVGVNYRLGALGYLFHPAVGPGNVGMLDQVAALTWVRDNIAAFGGDARRITVVGQSAGAAAIGEMLMVPSLRALFVQAVMQSGGFGRPAGDPVRAVARAERYLRVLEIDPDSADMRARLCAVPAQRLVEAQGALARADARFGDTTPPFGPIASEPLSAQQRLARMADGARGMNVLIGVTRDEGHAFFAPDFAADEAAVAARFAAVTGGAATMERYRAGRPGATQRDLLADLTTDVVFREPTFDLAAAIARQNGRVFAYQFDWSPPGSPFKACHCIELPFMFGNLDAWPSASMLRGGDAGEMQRLSEMMRRAWTSFVHDGEPAHDGIGHWPCFTSEACSVLHWYAAGVAVASATDD